MATPRDFAQHYGDFRFKDGSVVSTVAVPGDDDELPEVILWMRLHGEPARMLLRVRRSTDTLMLAWSYEEK